jgi:3-phenylpropionate/cinnamic acid dioxygenase small subunit
MDQVAARIAAELEIRNIIARIAILADQGTLDEYVDQFTEDSLWDLPTAPRHGRSEIRAGAEARRAEGITGPGSGSRHIVTTTAIAIDDGDRVVADSYFMFLQNTTTSPTILNAGVYHDIFVRQDGEWRLAHRRITLG